jgi:hypothetical protein
MMYRKESAHMKKILLTTLLLTGLAFAPRAFAQDEEAVKVDARLEGYSTPVYMAKASNTSVWFLLLVIGGITAGVMFINSKRSHLD